MNKDLPITVGDRTYSQEATCQIRGTITIKGHDTQIYAIIIKLSKDIIIRQNWLEKIKLTIY